MATRPREMRPPLAGVREAPFTLAAPAGDGLTLDGYAAVFNRETVIDSWEGRFLEKIAPGSMNRSFRESPPKIQFDHGRHPVIGSIPIALLRDGYPREEADPVLAPDGGAHVLATVFDNWMTEPLRDAIAAQAINGMSFRFEVMRESWHTHDGEPINTERQLQDVLGRSDGLPEDQLAVRTLTNLKVPELGPVAWPAYQDTSVSLRSTIIDLGRLNEPEQRRLLATAVFLADTAEQQEGPQQRTAQPAVAERRPECDTQQGTAAPAVAERPSNPVPTPRGLRAKDLVLRNQRDTLISIERVRDDRRSAIHTARGPAFGARAYPPAVSEAARRNPRPYGGNRRTG